VRRDKGPATEATTTTKRNVESNVLYSSIYQLVLERVIHQEPGQKESSGRNGRTLMDGSPAEPILPEIVVAESHPCVRRRLPGNSANGGLKEGDFNNSATRPHLCELPHMRLGCFLRTRSGTLRSGELLDDRYWPVSQSNLPRARPPTQPRGSNSCQ
jgi:hypothetical protein